LYDLTSKLFVSNVNFRSNFFVFGVNFHSKHIVFFGQRGFRGLPLTSAPCGKLQKSFQTFCILCPHGAVLATPKTCKNTTYAFSAFWLPLADLFEVKNTLKGAGLNRFNITQNETAYLEVCCFVLSYINAKHRRLTVSKISATRLCMVAVVCSALLC
jgi:hypothetical protein